jgi:hypothetical protein
MVTGAVELCAQSSTAPAGQDRQNVAWVALFDGKSLEGWRETPFTRKGKVRVEESAIVLEYGAPMTGVTFAKDFPKDNYEIRFEAARTQGNDFFASLTFPIGEAFCTWVLGGWGGDIVGISSIDGWDASENMTRSYFNFENGQWYKLRLRISDHHIRAWIDEEQVVNVDVAGRELSLRRGEIELSAPLGFASYNTTGRLRNIEYRRLAAVSSSER